VVTLMTSSAPNTSGTPIGSYSPKSSTGFVWSPSVVGTYNISAFLTLNGDTSCSSLFGVDSFPVTQQWIVDNP
jgi:hypothetical protein